MSCPSRFELFVGIEEGSASLRDHLRSCPTCAAIAEEERQLGLALERLRDPSAPAELLGSVMQRVEQTARRRQASLRQTAAASAGALLVVAVLLALFWRDLVVEAAVDATVRASQLRTAASALGGALSGPLLAFTIPVLAAQALAAIVFGLLLYRLLTGSRVRSQS